MASSSLNQELQSLVLQTLEKHFLIADTSKLVLPSAPLTPVDPQVVQAVLTSLASRNVNFPSVIEWLTLVLDCQLHTARTGAMEPHS
jgi:hypothetical protein